MKAKDNSIFTVTADSYEERELEAIEWIESVANFQEL